MYITFDTGVSSSFWITVKACWGSWTVGFELIVFWRMDQTCDENLWKHILSTIYSRLNTSKDPCLQWLGETEHDTSLSCCEQRGMIKFIHWFPWLQRLEDSLNVMSHLPVEAAGGFSWPLCWGRGGLGITTSPTKFMSQREHMLGFPQSWG